MRDRRLEVSVSFDERRGYVAHANGLPTITALSRTDASVKRLIGEDLDVKPVLERCAAVKRAAEVEWGHAHVGLFFKLAKLPRQHRARR